MTRITDHVYQDIVTGIVYDFKAGYKTQKGNEVPGGSVDAQTRELGDSRNQGTSLFETRESLMGRYAEVDAYRKKMLGRILRRTISKTMEGAGLKNPMIAHEEGDDISYPEVQKELQQIIGIEKGKSVFVRKAPIGPEGKPLVQFWQNPNEYWKKFKETFRGWGDSEKKAQDIDMISAGFNSPDEPVFGYMTTRRLFRNVDPDTVGNVLPNFKIPGTTEEYKTLFSHPEEYKAAAMQAKKEFSTVYREKPKEWNDIIGSDPNDIKDIPMDVKRRLAPAALSNMPKDKYNAIAKNNGIDEATAQRIRDYVKQSGISIQNNIVGMAWSDG